MKLFTLLAASIVLVCQSGAAPSPPWTGNPMTPGIAALTCTSSGDPSPLGQSEHVLAFLDLRDAIGCAATPIITPPTEWVLGAPRMFWPSNNDWSVANLGEVFGVDVRTGATSHVYVAAAGPKPCAWGGGTIWSPRNYNTAGSNTGSGGEVWRIHGANHTPLLLASLPNYRGYFLSSSSCINGNSFVGLGQVSVNTKPGINKVYVSNMDDGKIYVLNDGVFNTTYPCVFDHGATKPGPLNDDINSLYTQRGRLIFGLEYHPQANRLFYALRNAMDQDEIWSIGLDSAGCPVGSQSLEFISPPWTSDPVAASLPADIQFSDDGCRMLITQVSIRYENVSVTNVVPGGNPSPGAFAGPTTQLVPFHYAHTSRPYEVKRVSNAVVGGWSPYVTGTSNYVTGTGYSFTNSVAGDYGYGTLLSTPDVDSVVFVADVIRQVGNPSYKFGLEIHPLDDVARLNGLANFDVPLLSGNPSVAATKIQLNDLDILHEDSCAKIVTSSVSCPVGSAGKHTVTINITNTSSIPYWGINLTNCGTLPLLPGAQSITPLPLSPSPITLSNPLMPGSSTGPITVCLPGIPPAGGSYCFCVNLMDEAEGILCQRMVCVKAPTCTPPCAQIVAQDIHCVQGAYQFTLCVTNLQPQTVAAIKFSPAEGYLSGPVPSPNPLSASLPNGATGYYSLSLPAPSAAGGLHCFQVSLCDSQGSLLCREKVCLELPPCTPPCMTLSASNILCPAVAGGPYTLDLTIQNLTNQTVHTILLHQCATPPSNSTPVTPQPNSYINLGSPLLPNATTVVPVSLPALPCTGINACFCVTLFNQEPAGDDGSGIPTEPGPLINLCTDSICVELPPCDCPPCMTLVPGTILCPSAAGNPYSVTFTITNQQASSAYFYSVSSCTPPTGSATIQPIPSGPTLLPGGPLGFNATSSPLTVSLPAPLTGGSYCFCVYLLGEDQETLLCKERLCVNLPSCRCAEITNPVATCSENGTTQLTFTVANDTHLYPSPYAFAFATIFPASGFNPSIVIPSPNPITAGSSGTVTTTYVGPPGNTCITVIFSNAARTRCCSMKLCFENPTCEGIAGTCRMAPEFICKGGKAQILAYICNNAAIPKSFNWTISPTAIPGCVSLPAGAFSPSSGTTALIGPNSCVGISCSVNTASMTQGTCAGFQLCFTPVGAPGGTPPICCLAKIVCPGLSGPFVDIGDPQTLIGGGHTVGIPITIENPSDEPLTTELVPVDSDGLLTFSRVPLGEDGLLSAGAADLLITDESPLVVTLAPGETFQTTLFATYTSNVTVVGLGTIGIVRTCVPRLLDLGNDHGSTRIVYGLPDQDSSGQALPITSLLGRTHGNTLSGLSGLNIEFEARPGFRYAIQASEHPGFDPASTYLFTPIAENMIIEPDGSFSFPTITTSLDLPSELTREFFRFVAYP